MAIRDIYETTFDEDVQTDSCANQCPKCDGRITTNAVETVCEDYGLVVDEQRIDHGPEWRGFDKDERERTGAPLTATRHDRGLSTESGRAADANGSELSGQKRRRLGRMRREQSRGRFQSKAERNLARANSGRTTEGGPATIRRSPPWSRYHSWRSASASSRDATRGGPACASTSSSKIKTGRTRSEFSTVAASPRLSAARRSRRCQ